VEKRAAKFIFMDGVYDIRDGLINDLEVTLKDNKSLNQVYQLSI
jgi:hypothetical protein